MKTTAAMSGEPTRDSALLIADAIPAFRDGTEFISPVVSGATSSAMPVPKTNPTMSGPVSASTGGTRVDGSSRVAVHGCAVGGTVSHHSAPAAMTGGPRTWT